MEKIKLDHVTQVIGYHPKYLEHFLRTQNFIMYGDGPLPYNYRHFLAIMAAARHRCTYLVELFEREFLDCGGDETWLQGLDHIPKKLLAICEINKILAHRPWLLTPEHISALAKGNKYCWTMSEVVQAIVILSHVHSLSSFVFSCGLTQELENAAPIIPPPVAANHTTSSATPAAGGLVSNSGSELSTSPTSAALQKKAVDVLMAKMLNLSQQNNNECSEDELIDRFKNVEMQTAELSPTAGNSPSQITMPINVLQYIDDPGFTYVDFAKRGATDMPPTFRVQDYSWDDHGYSLVNRLYNDVGYLLDVKFRATYNLTYCTMVSVVEEESVWSGQLILNDLLSLSGWTNERGHVQVPSSDLELHPVHLRDKAR